MIINFQNPVRFILSSIFDNFKIMITTSQKIFVAGIKKLFFDLKQDLAEKNQKITWAMIADEIGESPSNLSGFITLKRNYSETKRKALAAYFKKDETEVNTVGLEQIKNTDEFLLKEEIELKAEQNWGNYLSGASEKPPLIMVGNAIKIISNAIDHHTKFNYLHSEHIDGILELPSNLQNDQEKDYILKIVSPPPPILPL